MESKKDKNPLSESAAPLVNINKNNTINLDCGVFIGESKMVFLKVEEN